MTEFEEAVAIEPESDAWRVAWALLGRDVPGGDTSGFEIAHARYMRDANGRRLLSVAFRHGTEDRTLPVFFDARVAVRRRKWWQRLLW